MAGRGKIETKKKRAAGKTAVAVSSASAGGPTKCLDRPFVVSVVTDFEAHALWMEPCVDLYCVAAEETKARLLARGAAARNVVATGIPISARDRKSTRLNSSHT